MKVNKKIITLNVENFSTGKIARWNDFVFLFDVTTPGMVQLTSDYNVVGRLPLKEVKKIDSVLFHGDFLIIADSLGHNVHRWKVTLPPGNPAVLSDYSRYSLPTNAVIVAAIPLEGRFIFLDKNTCMIRVYDTDFNEIKTVGSRMGYVQVYEDEESQRLGFEFPEDMAVLGDRVVVSDSGNKRLVVINRELNREKIFKLPEFPYKIIFCDRDRVVVSDFDRSLMTVSLEYGFIGVEESNYPVDFFQSFSEGRRSLVGSEQVNEIAALQLPESSIESLAEEAGNSTVLMRVKIDAGQLEEARGIALSDEKLLPEYAKYTDDKAIETQLTGYVEKTVNTVFEKIEPLKKEISTSSLEFIKKYKSIPGSGDKEAARIDKENIRHRMFLKLKAYRSLLKTVKDLKNALQKHPGPSAVFNRLMDARFRDVKQGIEENAKRIEANLIKFDETDLLEVLVYYWLFTEEETVLFPVLQLKYEKLFGKMFLLAILNDFYYNVAELFLKRGKVEEYISFADREITMYNDKQGIFKKFVHRLLRMKKYDDVLRMLDKFPDKNRENINYFHYRVYLAKGDIDKAFYHLKRELDLFSHRFELIPNLIRLNKLKGEEAIAYIDKILERSGHSIDTYLITAKAFVGIDEIEKAEFYVNKELELFPENQNAVAFKVNLLLNRPGREEELGQLVSRLKASQFDLPQATVYFVLGKYETSWHVFKNFIMSRMDEAAANKNIFLLSSLNYLDDESEIPWLMEMVNRVRFEEYKREFRIYLSFLRYFRGKYNGDTGEIGEIEKFDDETYISTYSTGSLAYDYFFEEVERLKGAGEWTKMFDLTEKILKYHPGDEKVFKFLDKLEKSVVDGPGN